MQNVVSHTIEKFGGHSVLAEAIGITQPTVSKWKAKGLIPSRWQPIILREAAKRGLAISAADLIPYDRADDHAQ